MASESDARSSLESNRRRNVVDDRVSGLERRRGPGRRKSDFRRAAEEGEMTPEQFLFIKAMDEFKRANNTFYPTWTDVLEVVRLLGYRKTQASQLRINAAEDWRESPSASHGVRPERWSRRFTSEELDALGELGEAA